MTTITKITEHRTAGNYTKTSIDINKQNVDFLIKQINPIVIKFKNGTTKILSKKQLEIEKIGKTYATDF